MHYRENTFKLLHDNKNVQILVEQIRLQITVHFNTNRWNVMVKTPIILLMGRGIIPRPICK